MDINRRAIALSTGLAGIAVLAYLVRYFTIGSSIEVDVLVAVQSLLIMLVPPLLAAGGAFYLLTADEATVGPVVAGFVLGGLLYGGSLLAIQWILIHQTVEGFLLILQPHVKSTVVFVGMAALGALGGGFIGPLRGEPTP